MSGDDWVPWESDEPAEFEDWFLGDDLADPFPGSDFDQDDLEDWESLAQSEAEDWRGSPRLTLDGGQGQKFSAVVNPRRPRHHVFHGSITSRQSRI